MIQLISFKMWSTRLRSLYLHTKSIRSLCKTHRLFASSASTKNEDLDDRPIKYTSSPAMQWSAKDSRLGPGEPRLWYEIYVVLGSIAVFLIYFGILREENDIDEELSRTLYSRIDGLEEQQLYASLEDYNSRGLDATDIIARLDEIKKTQKD